jgi:hypothetical protein
MSVANSSSPLHSGAFFFIRNSKGKINMRSLPGYRAIFLMAFAFLLTGAMGQSMAAERVTIVATVTDGYQIVDDQGRPYEVENTDKGNELVMNHVGSKVEVTGTVQDEVDYKIIVVDSFRVIEE